MVGSGRVSREPSVVAFIRSLTDQQKARYQEVFEQERATLLETRLFKFEECQEEAAFYAKKRCRREWGHE